MNSPTSSPSSVRPTVNDLDSGDCDGSPGHEHFAVYSPGASRADEITS